MFVHVRMEKLAHPQHRPVRPHDPPGVGVVVPAGVGVGEGDVEGPTGAGAFGPCVYDFDFAGEGEGGEEQVEDGGCDEPHCRYLASPPAVEIHDIGARVVDTPLKGK